MCLSTFFAFVIGSYLFLVSLAMLVHQQRFKKIMADTLSDHPLLALTGCLGIIFGLVIVTTHNYWVSDWPLLITLVGWFSLLQGIARLFAPNEFAKMCKQFHAKMGYYLVTWIWLLIGLYLIWAGFASSNAQMMMSK